MRALSIPRTAVIAAGVIGLIVGIVIGVLQIAAMFFATTSSYSYFYSSSNTLIGVAQETAIRFTNIWLAIAGIIGGLLLLMPVRMGRLLRAAGYTTPNTEVVPKAYRAGGIYMIMGGTLATISHLIFVRPEIVLLPLVAVIIGVIGLLAGLAKTR